MMWFWTEFKPLILTLLGTGFVSLCWFAYNHPRSFERISYWFLAIGMTVAFCMLSWSAGYSRGATEAFKHIGTTMPAAFDPDVLGFWPSIGFLILVVVLTALRFIHLLKDPKE
jgi:hypothetical protein